MSRPNGTRLEFHEVKPCDESATASTGDYRVRAIDRALCILAELSRVPEDLSGVELARKLNLNKSTVHRLLEVLKRNGFVERRTERGRYALGWQALEIGMAAAAHQNQLDPAKEQVSWLARQTGESAHLSMMRRAEIVSVVGVTGPHSERIPSTVGRRVPLHCTSHGKAILAFLPAPQVQQILNGHPFTRRAVNTITSKQRFLEELAAVRARGYAVDNEEFEEGLRCVGAPVCDRFGSVIAAIGIAGPRSRINGSRIPVLARVVMQAAAELSGNVFAARKTAPDS